MSGSEFECAVYGCTNKNTEGRFIGDFCAPCYRMITTGRQNPSNAWFMKEITFLEGKIIEMSLELNNYRKLVNDSNWLKWR